MMAIGAADNRPITGPTFERSATVMEFRHLQAFLAVARAGSFTRAAADLHYSQSTVTEQVQALEAELGARLFDRSGRRPTLTSAGQALVERAEQLVSLSDQARVAVQRAVEPVGLVTIGGLETLCAHRLPDLLVRFRSRYPRVRVVVRQGTRGELFAGVRRGSLDVGFTFGEPPADYGLSSIALEEVRLMVVAPPAHPLSGSGRVSRDDLVGAPFLATEAGCGFREMYDTAFAGRGPAGPTLVAEVGSLAALRACVASGMGLALLPEMVVAEQIERGELRALALEGSEHHLPGWATVTASWRPGLEPALGRSEFLDLLVPAPA